MYVTRVGVQSVVMDELKLAGQNFRGEHLFALLLLFFENGSNFE